jgi:hypothetical protein
MALLSNRLARSLELNLGSLPPTEAIGLPNSLVHRIINK